ncbi:MAG: hypothetical protein QW548_03050 [Candidatus Aenigmatarchaeota archaeon]
MPDSQTDDQRSAEALWNVAAEKLYEVECVGYIGKHFPRTEPHMFICDFPPIADKVFICPKCAELYRMDSEIDCVRRAPAAEGSAKAAGAAAMQRAGECDENRQEERKVAQA